MYHPHWIEEIEHINNAADYQSELWASEIKSMELEGYYAGCESLDEQLAADEISQACFEIRLRRLQKEYRVGPFEPAPYVSPEQQQDHVIDLLFAPGGNLHHMMRNEDNGPE